MDVLSLVVPFGFILWCQVNQLEQELRLLCGHRAGRKHERILCWSIMKLCWRKHENIQNSVSKSRFLEGVQVLVVVLVFNGFHLRGSDVHKLSKNFNVQQSSQVLAPTDTAVSFYTCYTAFSGLCSWYVISWSNINENVILADRLRGTGFVFLPSEYQIDQLKLDIVAFVMAEMPGEKDFGSSVCLCVWVCQTSSPRTDLMH